MVKKPKQLRALLFIGITALIPLVPASIHAAPVLLNLEGTFSTIDVMYYDDTWSNLEPYINLLEPPITVGQGERTWAVSGSIIIDDQVVSPNRGDYIRGRSADFNILSYDINFGGIYNISDSSPSDMFWLGPDSSLVLGSFYFGTGNGSRLDSGSYSSSYRSPWLDYNNPNTVKVEVGPDIYAAIARTNTYISSWENIVEVSEPSPIYLMILAMMTLIVIRVKSKLFIVHSPRAVK